MTQEIHDKLKNHDKRISSTEAITVSLFSKMDSLVTTLSESTKEQAVSNANQTHTNKTLDRMWLRIEGNEVKTQKNSDELNINRQTLATINKLPLYLASIGIMILGLCIAVVFKWSTT